MKNILILMTLASMMMMPNAANAKKSKATQVKIDYIFKNVVEGYDHKNKIIVYVDGRKVGESGTKLETEKNTFSFDITPGTHDIKIVNMAYYENKWEEHTLDNGYSYDCIVELDNKVIKKSIAISIIFDIDKSEPTYTVK